MLAVLKRELDSYYYSAIGYVFMGCFLLIAGIFFTFGNIMSASSSVGTLFSNITFIFILIVPILTMKLMSDERKSKTDQLLLTSPVSIPGIVVGKLGRKKGLETDDIYREVARELKHEAEAEAAGHRAVAVIAGGHTSFVFVSRDGETLLDRRTPAAGGGEEEDVPLTLARVWDFAMTSPLDELRFILETSRLNKAAAERSFAGEFGHCVGRTLCCDRERKVMGDSIFTRILSYTSAACDARMAGAMIPVMSNSGSGNQGIAATLPVVVYAEETHASEEQMIRALTLSHLTVIYIKQSLGRLSALCGCVVAATGSSCGITYLMGGGYGQAAAAVKNMIANLTGMICDGAKPSCAMKLTSGVSTAVLSAMMAMDGHCVTPVEGIIEEDVDKCIRNLTAIGRDGMNETDSLVLRIMTNKC